MEKHDIAVIGAGINGFTSALILQLMGYKTRIYANDRADYPADTSDPMFSSLYPAASVIPRNLDSHTLYPVFRKSIGIFGKLHQNDILPVSKNTHFEITETRGAEAESLQPDYLELMKNVVTVNEMDDWVPKRSEATVKGWKFDYYFAEMPSYTRELAGMYEKAGGSFEKIKLHRERLKTLPCDMIVNCSGAAGIDLFDDPADPVYIAGHLFHIPRRNLPDGFGGPFPSYTYTPDADVYCDRHGKPMDLYFYPRADGLIFGGSRFRVQRPEDRSHIRRWYNDELISVNGNAIPARLVSINRDIFMNTYGKNIEALGGEVIFGYRFTRDTPGGLRLETDQKNVSGKPVIHNYGHGGSGVGLSWGCALDVARKASKLRPVPDEKKVILRSTNALAEKLSGFTSRKQKN
ncbi:FAD-dependent oxidoreductase [Natronogracilivirga saccharolytica]|uniref:D-amino-acid oxidase n=1 Tax=Natronogracilivirga saccharolytica TaxID=2812953 RepID=A0A8J7RNH8_9BACT|nr:FAD-dependent oxidoreductase [Natronogracilivirga saccharolytica]MBP3193278.1 FAD-binding oxidoreductase [Natronogracilivirga saccharolytica]